jgi:ABC transport system ATP-binding/permease protein
LLVDPDAPGLLGPIVGAGGPGGFFLRRGGRSEMMRGMDRQAAAASTRVLTLQVLPAGPERFFDGSRPVTVGRDPSADVIVLDTSTSREHAILRLGPAGRWTYQDLSSNGSFLDGRRLTTFVVDEPVTLALGAADGGTRIRLVPPPRVGSPSPHIPQLPDYAPGESTPGVYTGTYRTSGSRVRIGRALDNDIVVNDLLASRHHAELRAGSDGAYEIVDLDSHNGTFVDGRRVSGHSRLPDGSLISVGHTMLRLRQGTLEEYVDSGQAVFAALDLGVDAGKKTLLDSVSFTLSGGEFLAVLGPTGAGKSTLLKALTGSRPADRGRVLYNGRDVYAAFAELRNRIGYVPQDDILHPQLTVRAALDYAARLRFPPDVTRADRGARVEEVMAELGLEHRADVRVERLSGGQRKRTSVAIELLTRPSLLILDEPTSGLDPGYEKNVMELLRSLADDGRTVLTVTHSIQSLSRCHRLLFLAPGGQTAFFGPPAETLEFFGQPDYPEIFEQLDRAAPGSARQAFAGSEAEHRYITEPLAAQRDLPTGSAPGQDVASTKTPHVLRQTRTLTSRYLSLISADKRNTLLLFAQGPILGLLMLVAFGSDNLVPGSPGAAANATTVLLALTLAVSYLGASNSIREIVKERPILIRERSVGLSVTAYVLSKVVVLGLITIAESFVLCYIALLRQGGPHQGVVLANGRLEIALVVSMTGLAAMALGLLVSAMSGNADKVLTILPIILFAQFVLSGAAFPVRGVPGLDEIAYLSGARWGYSASAATVHLDALMTDGCSGAPAPTAVPGVTLPHIACDPAHAPTSTAWAEDVGLLLGLSLICVVGTCLAVRPVGRPKRR